MEILLCDALMGGITNSIVGRIICSYRMEFNIYLLNWLIIA
jgi:hypothetical protein